MEKPYLTEIIDENQNLKHFHIFGIVYVSVILLSLTVSARIFNFHIPLTNIFIFLTAGTWTIPITFFVQDIVTEVYGVKRSKELVYIAVIIAICFIGYLKLTTLLNIPTVDNVDTSYNEVINVLPRHLIALIASVAIGNFVNSDILNKLKNYFKGKYLPFRFIFSTAIGEATLQLVGTSIAWLGSLHFKADILPFILFSLSYKIMFEIAMTPFNIVICNYLKKSERLDVYDR